MALSVDSTYKQIAQQLVSAFLYRSILDFYDLVY